MNFTRELAYSLKDGGNMHIKFKVFKRSALQYEDKFNQICLNPQPASSGKNF